MNLHRTIWATPGVVMILTSSALAQQAGSLRGLVLDRDFGAPVVGATVTLVETGARVKTSEQGNYVFESVAPGRYTVVIQRDGFTRQIRQDVLVNEGQLADLDFELVGEFEDMDEFVVQEIEFGGTEAALLTLRLESPQLLDSVSAEILSKSGAGDAAAALVLVPGASVQDGKYAVVRGLPDRYVSAQLDGVRLPTADAERRAVQLDQFPTSVIESVQVSKTFTPDQQGDASGGAVNIDLKDIPEETSFQIKAQANFNSQTAGRSDFLTYAPGGNVRYWGNNQGRDIPYAEIGQPWSDPVGTTTTDAPQDYKWSASGGGKWEVDDGVKVGAFASVFYDRDSSFFDNGVSDTWSFDPALGALPDTTALGGFTQSSLLDVTEASQSVQWGTYGAIGVETQNHKLSAKVLYSRTAENKATLATNTRGKEVLLGLLYPSLPPYDPNDPDHPGNNADLYLFSPYQRLETLTYTERTTASTILKGEHRLVFGEEEGDEAGGFGAPVIDWRLSLSEAVLDQPNQTRFAAFWLGPSTDYGVTDGVWLPLPPADSSFLGNAQHVWKKITETSEQVAVNLKLPFKTEGERDGYLKFGVFNDRADRSYSQQSFSNFGDPTPLRPGGFDEPPGETFPFENHPIIASDFDINYTGDQRVGAIYAMADVPIGEQFNLIGGARIESTTLKTSVVGESEARYFLPGGLTEISLALNPGGADANFDQNDVLPSLGLQWQALEDVVIRANVAQTIARQTFRELTPILQQEYQGAPIFIGNPALRLSSINNFDLRADYTPFDGWLFSASAFYKSIKDAIEYAQFIAPGAWRYTAPVNYPQGKMTGVELEMRVKMGEIDERLKGLAFGANATLIRSSVELPKDEAEELAEGGFPILSRDMTATPAYLVNLNMTYDIDLLGTQIGVFYNLQGDTLKEGDGFDRGLYIPAVYALPYGTLNFTIQQSIGEHWKIFFQAKNILNPEIQTVYRSQYLPGDILNTSYTSGVDFAIGASFQMNF